MMQSMRIWAPVVVSSMQVPQNLYMEARYPLEEGCHRLDDMKVKIRNCEVQKIGKHIEIQVDLEILCVMEDTSRRMQVMRIEQSLKERISEDAFDRPLGKDPATELVIDVQDLSWDGDLQSHQILIHYYLRYLIIAVRKQVIQLLKETETRSLQGLQPDELQAKMSVESALMIKKLQAEVDLVNRDNIELRRKIYLFERNILSLRRGLQKTEDRNLNLSRMLQKQVGKEPTVSKMQDRTFSMKKDNLKEAEDPCLQAQHQNTVELNLGQRIKRLFVTGEL